MFRNKRGRIGRIGRDQNFNAVETEASYHLHTREERRFFALAGDAVRSVSKGIVIGGRLMFRVACFTVGKATRHIRAVSSAYIERLGEGIGSPS